jgi:hypothetical protein
MGEVSEHDVVRLVRESLQVHHPTNITIDVIENGISQRNGSWYVPVRPSSQPPKTFEYYESLAEVESEIEENQNINVLLVPSMPLDSEE